MRGTVFVFAKGARVGAEKFGAFFFFFYVQLDDKGGANLWLRSSDDTRSLPEPVQSHGIHVSRDETPWYILVPAFQLSVVQNLPAIASKKNIASDGPAVRHFWAGEFLRNKD